jgi:hypothetical protein
MQRVTVAVVAALVVGLLTGTAGAGVLDAPIVTADSSHGHEWHKFPGDRDQDFWAAGAGKVDGGLQKFSLFAHEGPRGDFGFVSVSFTDPLGRPVVSYYVNVTCVNIHALAPSNDFDRGILQGVANHVSPVPNLVGLNNGDPVVVGIRDGGRPGAVPVDDFYAPNANASPASTPCKELFYLGNLANVTQGDVIIREF